MKRAARAEQAVGLADEIAIHARDLRRLAIVVKRLDIVASGEMRFPNVCRGHGFNTFVADFAGYLQRLDEEGCGAGLLTIPKLLDSDGAEGGELRARIA